MSEFKKITKTGYWICDKPELYRFDKGLADALAFILDGTSTIDMGCGNGAYVNYLREVELEIDGVDGNPHTEEISGGTCKVQDLTEPFDLGLFDNVLSLEVAEHIPEEYESIFIENLKRHARYGIIISWAVRGQGGHGHVNCKDNEEVEKLFPEFERAYETEEYLRYWANFDYLKKTIMVFRRK